MNENKQTVLTKDELDKFVGEIVEYGTDFVAPLYSIVEAIESAVLSKLRAAGEPSDEELLKWAGEEQFFLFCDEDDFLQIARAVLQRYAAPQASAEVRPLSQYGYQTLFDAISAATWTTAGGEIEVSVQAFRDALKSAPAAEDAARGAEPDIQAKLKDPNVVHVNMCRGVIAPITFDQLAHVLGDEATAAWLANRQQRCSAAEDSAKGAGDVALPPLVGTLAALPPHVQNVVVAYGKACFAYGRKSNG